jgi:inosine/xanthosine triphosphatase
MKTVAIASTNPAKVQATLNGLCRMFPGEQFRSESVDVLSGVSAQPMSDEETLQGAINRAQSARDIAPGSDFAVGLEAGCAWIAGSLYLFAWVVVIAGDKMGRARTATLPLPSEVSDLVAQKVELGEASDRVFGRVDSKLSSGSVGILTHDVIERTAYFEHAVVLSLIPFANPNLGFVA